MIRITHVEKRVHAGLASELTQRFPDYNKDIALRIVELEQLPYLTAVVKEVLSLSFCLPFRLPRVLHSGGAGFNGYLVPEGTVIG